MTTQHKFYQDILAKRGWLDKDGNFAWPENLKERRAMARMLFGLELVIQTDDRIEHAEDELYGTFLAAHSSPDRVSEEATKRRAVFSTMSEEQKAAALELIHDFARMYLFGLCCRFDQSFQCGLSMSLSRTNPKKPEEKLEFHPGDFLDMHDEVLKWLEDFSLIYGNEEEAQPKVK